MRIQVGDDIVVQEADYKYGTGVLSMRLTWIENSSAEWIQVKGTSQYWEGERWALIRRTAVTVKTSQ